MKSGLSTSEVYDKLSKDYKNNIKSDKLDHRFIEKFLTLLKPGFRVLDAGSGTGYLANEMQELHGLKVIAIDNSEKFIKMAKRLHPNVKSLKMDMRNLKFGQSYFNAIFANYSIIHLNENEIFSTLKNFSKVLKPKGLIYLSLQSPINSKQKEGYYPVVYKKNNFLFINLFTEEEINIYLKKAGFRILSCDTRKPDIKTEFPFIKLFITARKNS